MSDELLMKFTDKVMELFPEGPPDESVRDAIVTAEIVSCFGGNKGDVSNFVTINTERQYHINTYTGISIDAKQTRQGAMPSSWDVVFMSPMALHGSRLKSRYTATGGKSKAMLAVAQLADDFRVVKSRMLDALVKWKRVYLERGDDGIPPAAIPARQQVEDQEDKFEGLYHLYNVAAKHDAKLDFGYLEVTPKELSAISAWKQGGGLGHVEFLATVALHEIWIEKYEKQFEEELEMAKNNGGASWWKFTGSPSNLGKARKTLNKNSHLIVEGRESLYLYIQNNEEHFVRSFSASNNLRVKISDEPDWHKMLCGKRQTSEINQLIHEARCNACKRERSNQEKAEAANEVVNDPVPNFRPKGINRVVQVTSKKAGNLVNAPQVNVRQLENKAWQERNGEVITVQGPQETEDEDYEAKARENRRVSDELMERASYYDNLALQYEAMTKPTTAVQEAEDAMAEALKKAQEIINAAKAKEDADRKAQKEQLDALIASGPPA